MKYKSVIATQRGGPEVLHIIENDLRAPVAGEARIRVLATAVGRTDVFYRYGTSPFSPKVPFVPGYEIMGVVDALGPKRASGEEATRFAVGRPAIRGR